MRYVRMLVRVCVDDGLTILPEDGHARMSCCVAKMQEGDKGGLAKGGLALSPTHYET